MFLRSEIKKPFQMILDISDDKSVMNYWLTVLQEITRGNCKGPILSALSKHQEILSKNETEVEKDGTHTLKWNASYYDLQYFENTHIFQLKWAIRNLFTLTSRKRFEHDLLCRMAWRTPKTAMRLITLYYLVATRTRKHQFFRWLFRMREKNSLLAFSCCRHATVWQVVNEVGTSATGC